MPAVLRDPPWLRKAVRGKLPDLPDVELPAPRMHWPEGLQLQWKATMPVNGNDRSQIPGGRTWKELALRRLSIAEPLHAGLLSGEIVDLVPHLAGMDAAAARPVGMLGHLPAALRLLLWNGLPGFEHPAWDDGPASAAAMVAHYELAALPGLLAFIANDPQPGLTAALPVAAADIALHAAQALKSQRARPAAIAWLCRHAELASAALLKQSARGGASGGAVADAAIHWLATHADLERLRAGARPFGAAGQARLQAVLAVDPLPQKPRPLPGFYIPTGFRRPCLHDGRLLPDAVLTALGTMLQVSRLDCYVPHQSIPSAPFHPALHRGLV
jgi:hypothetical protein